MKQLGLKKLLLISILALVAISLSVYSYISYSNESKLLTRMITESTSNYVENQAQQIQDYMDQKLIAFERITDQYQSKRMEGTPEQIVEQIQLLANAANIDSALIGFESGAGYTNLADNEMVSNGMLIGDATEEPWYKDAMNNSGMLISNPRFPPNETIFMISLVQKISGGALAVDVNLAFLEKLVNDATKLPGSSSIVIDQDTTVLASSSEALKLGEKGSDIESIKEVLTNTTQQDSLVQEYLLKDVEKMMFSQRIHIGDKTWVYIVGLDKSVAFAELNAARNGAIIFTLGACLISLIAAFFIIQYLYRPILELKHTVLGLSRGDGDLTQRLEVKTQDDLGEIAGGINTFIESLQSMMLEIQNASSDLQQSISSLKLKSTHNADIIEQHAKETEQVVTAIEEMNATAGTMATDAANTAELTHKANESSELSQGTMEQAQQTVTALVENVDDTALNVQKLSDETDGISTILSVIGSIAEQTNLLALNAAIEAARAGEQGRGFAVVADEVRNLASRTKESTLEIESSLTSLLQGNQSVVTAMDTTKGRCEDTASGMVEVSDSLITMASFVSEISGLSSQIATAAEQQSSVTLETSQNMTAINDMVNELDKNGKDALDEAENIAQVNEQLTEIVNRFKL